MSVSEYILNVLLTLIAAFTLAFAGMLIWISYLLGKVADLQRQLRRLKGWHEAWTEGARRRQRL